MRKSNYTASAKSYDNRRHKLLPPEEMIPDTMYTCNINPEIQPLTPKFTLDLITWHNGMDNMFKSLKHSSVKLNLELSSNSRWHYHGTIKISNIMKFYIFDLPILKESCSLEIDKIEDLNIWTAYCTKQESLMKPICKEYGIPYKYESDKIMKVKTEPLQDTKFTELMKLCPQSELD